MDECREGRNSLFFFFSVVVLRRRRIRAKGNRRKRGKNAWDRAGNYSLQTKNDYAARKKACQNESPEKRRREKNMLMMEKGRKGKEEKE